MLVMLSAAIAPGLALLSYFYLKDQYETEPISVVVKTFLFGVFLVLPIMFIQYVLETEHILNTDLANAFLWAALLEEFFKWFILIYVIYQHVAFDEPYDGIVYGAAVSLDSLRWRIFYTCWPTGWNMLFSGRFSLYPVMLCSVCSWGIIWARRNFQLRIIGSIYYWHWSSQLLYMGFMTIFQFPKNFGYTSLCHL